MSDKSSLKTKVCSEYLSIHCVLHFLTSKDEWTMQCFLWDTGLWHIESPSFLYNCTKCIVCGVLFLE